MKARKDSTTSPGGLQRCLVKDTGIQTGVSWHRWRCCILRSYVAHYPMGFSVLVEFGEKGVREDRRKEGREESMATTVHVRKGKRQRWSRIGQWIRNEWAHKQQREGRLAGRKGSEFASITVIWQFKGTYHKYMSLAGGWRRKAGLLKGRKGILRIPTWEKMVKLPCIFLPHLCPAILLA